MPKNSSDSRGPASALHRPRKRDEEKLKGFFDAVDAAGNLIPKQGPDAMAFAAISFIKSLTANLGLLH